MRAKSCCMPACLPAVLHASGSESSICELHMIQAVRPSAGCSADSKLVMRSDCIRLRVCNQLLISCTP